MSKMAEKTQNPTQEHGKTERSAFISKCVSNLTSNGYTFVKHLGKGTFGDVMEFIDENQERSAFKMVDPKMATLGEIKIWPKLHHKNVQPVTEIIDDPTIPAILFKMPVQLTSLEDMIENRNFYNSPDALLHTIHFLTEILEGLKYLQSKTVSHMDLKTNNILISPEGRALLCDFTFVASAKNYITNYGTPLHLRPPEACWSKIFSTPVNGFSFDAWTFGLLALDCVTRHVSWSELPTRPQSWSSFTYPALFRVLEVKNFKKRVRWAFPGSCITKEQITSMRNFILMFLRHDPEERPTAKIAAQHEFLGRGSGYSEEDRIWKTIEQSGDDHRGSYAETQPRVKLSPIQVQEENPKRLTETQETNLNVTFHIKTEGCEHSNALEGGEVAYVPMQVNGNDRNNRRQKENNPKQPSQQKLFIDNQRNNEKDAQSQAEILSNNVENYGNYEAQPNAEAYIKEYRYDVNNAKDLLVPDKKKKRGMRGMVKWLRTKTRAFKFFK